MELLHALLGSLFTLLITGSVSFIAYKVVTIGSQVSEIKDALTELQRGSGSGSLGAMADSVSSARNYPSSMPAYNPPAYNPPAAQQSDYGAPAAEQRTQREFVLPPPISRRLDAERGIQRGAGDEFSMGERQR